MTPQARRRAPFELLRLTAVPVPGALVVVELEGRFSQAQPGRFPRPPVLVVDPGGDRPRLELAPARTAVVDGRWSGAYAVPAEAFATASLALGVRGTLLELPAPDEPGDADRLTALAREANGLRRALEAAEHEAATARDDAAASVAALQGAVEAAREEARAESAERIDALEHEVVEAHRLSAQDVEAARAAALAEATAGYEQAAADATARAEAAELHAEAAESRARDGEQRAAAAESGTEVLRAELAEERERSQATIAELREELEEDATTRPLAVVEDLDETRPFTVAEERDADDDATLPFGPQGEDDDDATATTAAPSDDDSGILDPVEPDPQESAYVRHGPNLSPWFAVGALALFAFALLGLLFGFLA